VRGDPKRKNGGRSCCRPSSCHTFDGDAGGLLPAAVDVTQGRVPLHGASSASTANGGSAHTTATARLLTTDMQEGISTMKRSVHARVGDQSDTPVLVEVAPASQAGPQPREREPRSTAWRTASSLHSGV